MEQWRPMEVQWRVEMVWKKKRRKKKRPAMARRARRTKRTRKRHLVGKSPNKMAAVRMKLAKRPKMATEERKRTTNPMIKWRKRRKKKRIPRRRTRQKAKIPKLGKSTKRRQQNKRLVAQPSEIIREKNEKIIIFLFHFVKRRKIFISHPSNVVISIKMFNKMPKFRMVKNSLYAPVYREELHLTNESK